MGINILLSQTRMGIDLVKRGRFKNKNKKCTKSKNLYHHLLIKLFTFLTRRTDPGFCKTVLRRLIASRTMRPPVSLSRLVKHLGEKTDRTAVVVGCVTDDERQYTLPKLNVFALRFTETARARIVAAGGSCMELDQFAMQNPTGSKTLLLRGPTMREVKRFWGAAGIPHSHVKPRSNKKEKKTGLS